MIRVSPLEGYELWASTWDETPSPIVALEERSVLPWIEALRPRRTIDIGCGTGRWTARLGAIGIDGSPAMLSVAAGKNGLKGRLAVGQASVLPVADQCADLVLCTLTLGHVSDPGAAMREFARILVPGGMLILSDFHPAATLQGWRRTFHANGQSYELENHTYAISQLQSSTPDLILCESAEPAIGEPERPIFLRAGKPELFEPASRIPAVLLTRWRRP